MQPDKSKSILISSIFGVAYFFLPIVSVFAHNGIEDGDSQISAPPTSTERLHVAIGLAILVVIAGLVIWWFRRKK